MSRGIPGKEQPGKGRPAITTRVQQSHCLEVVSQAHVMSCMTGLKKEFIELFMETSGAREAKPGK